jgi:phosphate transport system protein
MTGEHIVSAYDEELRQLDQLVARMGGLAEAQLAAASDALVRRDREAANAIAARDGEIDALEAEINAFVLRVLALRQPLAEDLRAVVAALKIAADLERIGDYVRNMANRTGALAQTPTVGDATHTITRMSRLVQGMIKNVLDAYVGRDVALADDVRGCDQEVDYLHTSLFRELLTYMMEDPRTITTCTHLLFISKNIERMGDHATDIAEHVHAMVIGEEPEPGRPKGDRSSFTVVPTPKRRKDDFPE